MQIAVLVEQMRREGYEVLVSRPEVLKHQDENGKWLEPIEKVFLEVPQDAVGDVMEALATRKGNVTDMAPAGDRMTLDGLLDETVAALTDSYEGGLDHALESDIRS